MSLFDQLKRQAESALRSEARTAVTKAVNSAVSGAKGALYKAKNEKAHFTFESIPQTLEELKALPEAKMDTPYKTVALSVLALCNFERDPEMTMQMLDYLNGPDTVSPANVQFYTERLEGKQYKAYSFFEGSSPENGYTPKKPYKLTVTSNPYSFTEENYATLYIQSTGADELRAAELRKKPSTGQWFIREIMYLQDIRVPKDQDPWA